MSTDRFDDICRCGVICTCGGDDWGEEYDLPGDEEWPALPTAAALVGHTDHVNAGEAT